MNLHFDKSKKSDELKNRVIKRQSDEIESLKMKILNLENKCKEKDEVIASIDSDRKELSKIVDDLKSKSDECDALLKELNEMKKVMNQEVFKGRWRLVRLLLK